MGVIFESGGMSTGFNTPLTVIGSAFPVVAAASLPVAAAGNAGQIYQITDFNYPYVLVQSNGSVWKQITHFRTLWDSLPAAATFNDFVGYVENIPVGGKSLWYSNGSDWYPVAGKVVLADNEFIDPANPQLGLISTTSQTMAKIAGWSLTIPANLFKGVGTLLRITGSGARAPSINSAGPYVGVMAYDLDPNKYLASAFFSANNNICYFMEDSVRKSNTTVFGKLTLGNSNLTQWNSAFTVSSFASSIAWDEATEQTLFLTGIVTSTANDTIYARKILVELFKVP